MYPKFERVPNVREKERFICVLSGTEQFKIVSPVFRQNLYQQVYDSLHPSEIPDDINLFQIDEDRYPLMAEI